MKILLAAVAVVAVVLLAAVQVSSAFAADAPRGDAFKRMRWLEGRVAVHRQLAAEGERARWHAAALRWTTRELREAAADVERNLSTGYGIRRASDQALAWAARREVARGGVYSSRWGAASARLKALTREILYRGFRPYGTQRWAAHIVYRESGFNPGAVNASSYATGLAQMMPSIHTWVNYTRVKRDVPYAVAVFVKLSRGGRVTGPWRLW